MRVVAWNCNMALHRKFDALLSLRPDVAIISECAEPERLRQRLDFKALSAEPVWIGRSPHKGLAVLGFGGHRPVLDASYRRSLKYIAPVRIEGPSHFNLLAVWAQNFSAGIRRKRQPGPLRLALRRYRGFLAGGPSVIAGDFNNNVFWDKPGWLMNHSWMVEALGGLGLASAYHVFTGEAQGGESRPTLYWRDRIKDGPTYHIDYIFLPQAWTMRLSDLSVGSFEEWCQPGFSDHVSVVADIAL
jgi:exodeoxyribonuclease III